MRYSRGKKIAIAIITVVCILVIGFGIYKGIDYSKSLTEDPSGTKLKASVSEKKETKKTTTKKKTTKKETKTTETKKTETKTTETKKTETKKEETKTETKKEETKKQEVE